MSVFLELRDINHFYGQRRALQGLSLKIPKFSTCAFVGANGAGKTTTYALICGFLCCKQGEILLDGKSWHEFRARSGLIGLLPQEAEFFESRSVYRQLYLFSKLCGLNTKQARDECERVLDLVKLSERANDLPSTLSRGMKVRLGLAQALIATPPLILLDEPTAGLDPLMLVEFRELIQGLKGKTTLMISSHDLSELQAICDYVCIIDRGKLVRQGSLGEMLESVSMVRIKIAPDSTNLDGIKSDIPHASINLENKETVIVEFDASQHQLPEINKDVLSWLLEKGVPVLSVEEPKKSLEQAYLEETAQKKK